jgi:gluconolactonase
MISKRTFLRRTAAALALPAVVPLAGCQSNGSHEPLWTAKPLTQPGEFTLGIEGPACDRDGNVYAVNYRKEGTIGRTRPDGTSEVFVELPGKSIGNGIVFDRTGQMFVADYTQHNVLQIDPRTRKISVFAHNPKMNQPNDLAMAPDGTLFASDPGWKTGDGQLWRIDKDGSTHLLAQGMGTTNGIEVSPDGSTLYVNESVQRNVWAFTLTPERNLTNKRLLRKFEDFGFDGMRADVDGNLYITRHGAGLVAVVSPQGEVLRTIPVLGSKPSNLCFGGPDGRTIYVTEVEHTRLVTFRTERPGLAWKRLRS